MIINDKIRKFGELLKDRLDPSLVNSALEYIDFSENVLAFETLCDHIGDFDIKITDDEYDQIIDIAKQFDLPIDHRYLYIKPNKNI
ncbi:MafI family immunity protein [Photorhabdus antumapuensis]|uniref:MafI family immunity protein n=1 Tax=Photorhabdus antumapuensis TaxID=2862867 RepID=UPI001CEC58FC|nr:MafI family immunity protein [Photorhabdus antumapuensis]MCA6223108.1 MafI family immunity protein [Photorhabdus antumapuensis]